MLVRLILSAIFLFILSPLFVAYACPPRQVPLHELSVSSEFIVVGRIEALITSKSSGSLVFADSLPPTEVEIRIISSLKGNAPETIKYVDDYLEAMKLGQVGDIVLAFLVTNKKTNELRKTSWLSSVKKLDGYELSVYVKRVKEILAIEQQEDKNIKDKLLVQWLVNCAVDPITRWDGAYELASNSEMIKLLTSKQKDRLANILFSSLEIENNEILLVNIAKDFQDERFLPFVTNKIFSASEITYIEISLMRSISNKKVNGLLPFIVKHLKADDTDRSLYITDGLMDLAVDISQKEKARPLVKKFSALDYTDETKNKREAIVAKFIRLVEQD